MSASPDRGLQVHATMPSFGIQLRPSWLQGRSELSAQSPASCDFRVSANMKPVLVNHSAEQAGSLSHLTNRPALAVCKALA